MVEARGLVFDEAEHHGECRAVVADGGPVAGVQFPAQPRPQHAFQCPGTLAVGSAVSSSLLRPCCHFPHGVKKKEVCGGVGWFLGAVSPVDKNLSGLVA